MNLSFDKLDAREFRHWVHFKDMKTQYGLVMDSIEVSKELKETYQIYQVLLGDIKSRNIELIKRVEFGYKSFFHFRNRILITLKLREQFDM